MTQLISLRGMGVGEAIQSVSQLYSYKLQLKIIKNEDILRIYYTANKVMN